jgi:acetoin utilization deacetylase AcuC-like enzyme
MIKLAFALKHIYELPPGHRFPIVKYELVKEQLVREGYFSEDHIYDPGMVEKEHALLTHSEGYWQKLHEKRLTHSEIKKIGLPIHDRSVDWAKNAAAGAIKAALQALDTGIGLSLAGGTHHAFSNHGEGFCILNDVAVASNYLLKMGLVKKILVLDLDVHQGNGTAAIFAHDQRVFTFSMHGKDNYPLVKEKSDWDIAFPTNTGDNEYLSVLKSALEKLFNPSLPDVVFYVAGVDVLESDALGKLALTKNGCRQRDEMVLSACHKKQVPIAITMGGGYSPRIGDIVDAHSNTFKTAIDIFG